MHISESVDPMGHKSRTESSDPGQVTKKIDNYVDGTPGSDDDRTVEYAYDSAGRLDTITAKATTNDQVTQYIYGVSRGTDNSLVSSNELVYMIKYPDPDAGTPGQPGGDAKDQERFGYDARRALVWKKDQQGTEHFYDYDERGRLTQDRVPTTGTGIDTSVLRIARTYDRLDRQLLVTSYNNATVGSGTILNEIQYVYSYFSTVTTIYQEWAGAVNTGTSKKVQFAYSYPTNGTTGLRLTSTTHPDGTTVISEVYNSGMDDTISRVSGRKNGTTWLFQESYLGLGKLVERQYGSTGMTWTLVGTDSSNQDNYLGLDRFGRIDELVVKTASSGTNDYLYTYDFNSQVTVREDLVGNVGGSYEFSETFAYDGLGRLTDHRRGKLSGGVISGTNLRLHECWTLDRSGNSTAYYSGTNDSCATPTVTAGFNASNEYTNRNGDYTYPAYNDAGDLTKRGTNDIVYDAWNRVERVKNNGNKISTYKYNGQGQMINRGDASQSDAYFYYNASWQVVEERGVISGATINWYVWGTQYIDDLVVRGPTTQYSVHDVNFNVVARLDSSAAVVARHVYDSYGTPKQLSANWSTWQSISEELYLFTGRHWRRDPAQYDYRNRVMDPGLGVFVQRDPIGIWGDMANAGNGYAYIGDDPVGSADPFGLNAIEEQVAVVPIGRGGPVAGNPQNLRPPAAAAVGGALLVAAAAARIAIFPPGNWGFDYERDAEEAWRAHWYRAYQHERAPEPVPKPQPGPIPVPPPVPMPQPARALLPVAPRIDVPPPPPPIISGHCNYYKIPPNNANDYERRACNNNGSSAQVCLPGDILCAEFDGWIGTELGPGTTLLECKDYNTTRIAGLQFLHNMDIPQCLKGHSIAAACGNPIQWRYSKELAAGTSSCPNATYFP